MLRRCEGLSRGAGSDWRNPARAISCRGDERHDGMKAECGQRSTWVARAARPDSHAARHVVSSDSWALEQLYTSSLAALYSAAMLLEIARSTSLSSAAGFFAVVLPACVSRHGSLIKSQYSMAATSEWLASFSVVKPILSGLPSLKTRSSSSTLSTCGEA